MRANAARAQRDRARKNTPATAGSPQEASAQRAVVQRTGRRGRPGQIDAAYTTEIAAGLESILGRGFDLVHSSSGLWHLRRWDSWFDVSGKPRMAWLDVDEAREGELDQLLLRHQERR